MNCRLCIILAATAVGIAALGVLLSVPFVREYIRLKALQENGDRGTAVSKSGSIEELVQYARKLGELRSEFAAGQLLNEMRQRPDRWYWRFHRAGIEALAEVGQAGVPAIVAELGQHTDRKTGVSSGECSVRFHQDLMRLAGRIGPAAAAAVPSVMWHARDTASQAMEHANEALDPIPEVAILARIANPAAPVLSELIKDNEPDVLRVEAAVRLWGAGEPKRAGAVLQELTQSASAGVRRRARQALGLIEASSETPSGKQ
jgi:hypothetical protein